MTVPFENISTWRERIGKDEGFPLHAPTEVERAMVAEIAELRAAPSVCNVPPLGWHCTRKPGHDGPCAAVPADSQWEELFRNLALALNCLPSGFIDGNEHILKQAKQFTSFFLASEGQALTSAAMHDQYVGKWSISVDEENFSGEFDSEQEAIAEATAQGYAKFWIGQCVHPVDTLPDAKSIGESVVQQCDEWAYEECGGDDRIFDVNDEDATKLGQLVRDFIKRESSVQRYGVINITLHQPVTSSGALVADNDGAVA